MKKSILLVCVGWLLAALPCTINAETVYDAASVADYGCGGHRMPASTRSSDEEEESWQIEYNAGVLSITWLGYIADCCHEEYESRIEMDGTHIIFYLTAEDGMCDCICSYDVTSTFSGIEPGQYTISFYGTDVTTEITIEEDCGITIRHSQAGIQKTVENGMMDISAEGLLRVSVEDAYTVEIFDAAGLRHGHIDSNGPSEFNLTMLPKGIYTVRLTSGTQKSVIRFAR